MRAPRPEPPRNHPETSLDYALSRAGVSWGNTAALLPGGAQAFPEMLAAIEGARREVLLESYIFADDYTGRAFFAALEAAARRGCTVRVICDGVGSFSLPGSRFAEMAAAGAHMLRYRPIAPWRPRWGLWRRDHRKLVVVDGNVGFLGGLNIADEYDDRREVGRPWRDFHVRIEGPAAAALRQVFVAVWNGENDRTLELPLAATTDDVGPRGLLGPLADVAPVDAPAPVSALSPVAADALAAPERGVAVQVIGNTGFFHRGYLHRAFLYAIKRSQRAVYIANPYFIPDRAVARALSRAARRGVDVRILIPFRSDILLCDLASRAALPSLLKDGVRVAEWRAGMMHAKAASVDGRWATVGSYNLDRRSFTYNLEVTANFLDVDVASQVQEMLLRDFNAASEIDRVSFAQRPFWLKALQALAYRFRSLL